MKIHIQLNQFTRERLKTYARKHKQSMAYTVYRFLTLYLTASKYAHTWESQTKSFNDDSFMLPDVSKAYRMEFQMNFPKEDWEILKHEAPLRKMTLHDFIESIVLMLLTDFEELDRQVEEK